MLRGTKRLLLQAWPLLPSSPDPGGAPFSFRGWQGYLWAGQGNRRRWNPRPPARLPPALRLSARAEPGIHFPALSDHSYHLSFQLGFLKHTDHLKKQTLPAPNSPLQAPKPPDPGYSSHSHNSQGGSPASAAPSASLQPPRAPSAPHPSSHPATASALPVLRHPDTLPSDHPLRRLRHTSAPDSRPRLPRPAPRPGPSSPASASAAASPAASRPRLTSALRAQRPPRRPRPAHAGGWGWGRSARLPAGSRPPSCSPAAPQGSGPLLCVSFGHGGAEVTEVAGEGGGREGVLGRMREREAGAAIFVPGGGRVLALQRLNAERS